MWLFHHSCTRIDVSVLCYIDGTAPGPFGSTLYMFMCYIVVSVLYLDALYLSIEGLHPDNMVCLKCWGWEGWVGHQSDLHV